MQLSIFEQTQERTNLITGQESSENIYERWKMYEYLESLSGKTARLVYHTNDITIKAPIEIGDMLFSNISVKTFPEFHSFNSPNSNIKMSGSKVVSVVEESGVIRFRYMSSRGDLNQPTLDSITSLEVMPFENKRAKLPDLDNVNSIEELKERLLGKTVKLHFYLRDDVIHSVEDSLSFRLTELQNVNGQLRISGTNGVEVICNGYYGFRISSGILLDCSSNGAYTGISIVD
jgi:hypothetical protein